MTSRPYCCEVYASGQCATCAEEDRLAYGRCDRCGEPFREDDARAEVTEGLADATPLPALIIHAECMVPSDYLA